MLGTTKNNYNSFVKSFIPLPRGGYAVRRGNSRLIHKQVSFIEIYIKLCIISGMIDYISGYPFYYDYYGKRHVRS